MEFPKDCNLSKAMPLLRDAQDVPEIPDYELVRKIGEGAFGEVWLAQGMTGAFRAIKIVWKGGDESLNRFEQEFSGLKAFTALSVREPRQLALLHVGQDTDKQFFYYVMELADDVRNGREIDPQNYAPCTLHSLYRKDTRLPPKEVVRLGLALAEALASMHEAGLVHRDIKLTNIILVGGVPKMADIGLVREIKPGRSIVGTAGYIPPEGPGMPTADVYSFGKLLYELSTGFDRDQFPRRPDLPEGHPDLPELAELEEVWKKACQEKASDRHANGEKLREELMLLRAQRSVRQLRGFERQLHRLRRVGLLAFLMFGMLVTVATMAIFLRAQREQLRRATYAAQMGKATLHTAGLNNGAAIETLQLPSGYGTGEFGFEYWALLHEAEGFIHTELTDVAPRTNSLVITALDFAPDSTALALLRDQYALTWTLRRPHAECEPSNFLMTNAITRATSLGWGAEGHRLYVQGPATNRWEKAFQVYEPWPTNLLKPFFPPRGIGRVVGSRMPPKIETWLPGKGGWTLDPTHSLPFSGPEAHTYFWDYDVDQFGDHVVSRHLRGRNHNARFSVVISSLDLRLSLWRLETSDVIHGVAISPDGQWIAVSSNQSTNLSVYHCSTNKAVWSAAAHAGQLRAIRFSRDSRWLASGADDGRVKLWDTATGAKRAEMSGPSGSIRSLAWNPDSSRLAAGTSEGKVAVWPLNSDALPQRPVRVRNGYWLRDGGMMLLSPDSRWLAASGLDGSLMVSPVTNLEERFCLTNAFAPLQFSPNHRGLIARDIEGGLVYCQLDHLRVRPLNFWIIPTNTSQTIDISWVATSPNGAVFICTTDGTQSYWEFSADIWNRLDAGEGLPPSFAPKWRLLPQYIPHESYPGFVNISPEGDRVVCGYRKRGRIEVRNSSTGKILRSWDHSHHSSVYAVLLGPKSDWCAVGDEEDRVVVYSLRGEKETEVVHLKVEGTPCTLALGGAGARLVCGTTIGAVQFFSSDTWTPLTEFRINDPAQMTGDMSVRDLLFTNDKQWLAARTSAGTVQVWDGRPSIPSRHLKISEGPPDEKWRFARETTVEKPSRPSRLRR